MIFHVSVRDRIATYEPQENEKAAVCENSGDTVEFNFDSEWQSHNKKTARFIFRGKYIDVEFVGNTCPVPIIEEANSFNVGVYVGEMIEDGYQLSSTRVTIPSKYSIRDYSKSAHDESGKNYTNEARGYAAGAKASAESAEASAESAEKSATEAAESAESVAGVTKQVTKNAKDIALLKEISDGTVYVVDENISPVFMGQGRAKIEFDGVNSYNYTVTLPYDTVVSSNRLGNKFTKLPEGTANCSLQTTATKIYYNISTKSIVFERFDTILDSSDNLLLATVRKKQGTFIRSTVNSFIPFDVYIGGKLQEPSLDVVNYVDNVFSGCEGEYDKNVKGINHRGYNVTAPENTLAAYRLSKTKGFKYVECDVSFTSDGYAVLLHDDTVDRTSNGTGNIADMTLEEVKTLDFGSWKSDNYTGEQIPTFEEFIILCKRLGLHPYIEIKNGNGMTPKVQIEGLVDTVVRHGMKDKVTWISFNDKYLGYIRDYDEDARLGYVVNSVTESVINNAVALKTDNNEVFVDCAYQAVTNEVVSLCINANLPLEVWTVNVVDTILTLDPYVSGVTSDNKIAGKVLIEDEI